MATHASSIKRHQQSIKKQTRNRWWKSRIRSAARKVIDAATKKDKNLAGDALRFAMKEIGKAKSKGVVHRNTAARKVSRLSKLVSSI